MIHAACATFYQQNFITLYISEAIYSNASLGESIIIKSVKLFIVTYY